MNKQELTKQIAVLALSLAVSVLAGFIPDFKLPEQTLFTVTLFTAFVLLDVVWLLAINASRQAREYDLWAVRDQADQELTNIRHHFAEIAQMSHGRRDLFISYFIKEIQSLGRKIKDAADKKELRTASEFYIKAEDIFDAFVGDENPVLRYTWPLEDNDRLFEEPAWWRFFEVKARMVEQKAIKGVQVLLILNRLESVKTPRIQKLLDFFHTNVGQECRIIVRDAFKRICTENGVPSNYLDFGIYGNRMLFRSEQYTPEYIGVYTKDVATIQMYARFFDALWDSPAVSKQNPSMVSSTVTCAELMAFDSQDA